MSNLENDLIKKIEDGYREMLSMKNGERSNNKLKPIHELIASAIKERLPTRDYKVYSLHKDNNDSQINKRNDSKKERSVEGKYYDKNIDIAVTYKDKDIAGISIKFIVGNYNQNSNNYFENLLGETANLKTNSYKYASFIILPKYLPYKQKQGELSKIEQVTSDRILKYYKLSKEEDLYHRPDLSFFFIIDTGNEEFLKKSIGLKINNQTLLENLKLSKFDHSQSSDFDDNIKAFIDNHSNIDKFINAFVNLVEFNAYGK